MDFRMECHPAFNYARDDHETSLVSDGAAFASAGCGLGMVGLLLLSNLVRPNLVEHLRLPLG